MNTKHTQTTTPVDEIRRYLEAVELFRSLGHEPQWRPETVLDEPARAALPPSVALSRRAH
jgi:hypothetical protein